MAAGPKDVRDQTTWVVLELTKLGEQKVVEGVMDSLLREMLQIGKDHPIFIPSAPRMRRGESPPVCIMDGYAFVASGLSDMSYYRLEGTSYVRNVLTGRSPTGMRTLNVVPDATVQKMKDQLSQQVLAEVQEGAAVIVSGGTFNNLKGTVISDLQNDVFVLIELRSIHVITMVPKNRIRPVTEEDE